jgi:hypothetical protein
VGRIDDALLFRRQITGEAWDAIRLQPDAAVGDFNPLEDVRLGNLSCWPCNVSVSSGPKP